MCQIAECNHQYGCTDLSYGRIEMQVVYKKLHEHIIEHDADGYQYEITKQLNTPANIGVREYHIFAEQEAGWERHSHRHKQGCYMRADIDKGKVYDLVAQDVIIGNEIQEYIQQRITSSAGKITEGLSRHKPGERLIEEIKYL